MLTKYKHLLKEDFETVNTIYSISKSLYKDIKRKDGITPYIVHPEAVTEILLRNNIFDKTILSVAFLHDVLEENTQFKYNPTSDLTAYLSNYFSDKEFIQDLVQKVMYLSFFEDPYKKEELPYMKALHLAEIVDVAKTYPDILIVKLADRLANIMDFYNSGAVSYSKKYFTRAEVLFGAAYQFQSDFSDHYQNLLEMENKTDDIRELIEYNLKYMFYFQHLINKLKEVKQTIYQK